MQTETRVITPDGPGIITDIGVMASGDVAGVLLDKPVTASGRATYFLSELTPEDAPA